MAVAFVQSKNNIPGGSGTTVAVTFTSNVVAGNLIAVGVIAGNTGSTITVADNLGNTYTAVTNPKDTSNGFQHATFYAKNIIGGAATVTATYSAATAFRHIFVHEISGADTAAPLDGSASQFQGGAGTGVDAVSSGSFTTTTNGDYIFGFMNTDSGGANTLSAGTNYTIRENPGQTDTVAGATEDRIQASSGAIAATFTQSANQFTLCSGLAFKPAAAAVIGGSSMPVCRVRLRAF